jgi:hypothetical protein
MIKRLCNKKGESYMGNHTASLILKHAELDRQLHDEALRPQPDQNTLAQLKKEKLKIKDKIEFA